jgi:hypothetical protein
MPLGPKSNADNGPVVGLGNPFSAILVIVASIGRMEGKSAVAA